jgi:TfoX/Sxy family transcriptional regulator of competence genes
MTPDERFAAVASRLGGRPGVTVGESRGRFGSSGLQVGGRIFAMLVRGSLVVKLPRQRVDALVAAGQGERYDPRRDGRLMKEWLVVAPDAREDWQELAEEALRFVGSGR